jgi:DNA-binding winged helix-turn-helix (wHTH) protein
LPRYRFDAFTISPRRRVVLQDGRELPLIPRYFDLLVFLIERRHEAVHRREIFDRVWADVIVSDSALSQAIRTLRRTLGDDSREPRFIRTVSRHGYRFVFDGVTEEVEEDSGQPARESVAPDIVAPAFAALPATADEPAGEASRIPNPESRVPNPESPPPPLRGYGGQAESRDALLESLLARLTRRPASEADEEDQRDAAEILHGLGTADALRRLGDRPGHHVARAVLRDTRWNVPGAGSVPLLGTPGGFGSAAELVRLRVRRAARIVAERWAAASVGAGAAGAVGGVLGGLLVATAPGSTAPLALAAVLALVGLVAGATGGAGVGAGLAAAEATARSWRRVALAAGGALGGAVAGLLAQWLGRVTLATVVGMDLPIGGGWEGVTIGGAAGLGYAASVGNPEGGFAAPRGARRARAVLLTAAATGLAALLLTAVAERPLVGGTIHTIATASRGAQAMLTPLGRLVGESDFGPLSRTIIGTGEGVLFGLGLALGLTRRPR